MIRVRLNPVNQTEVYLKRIEGESLRDIFKRFSLEHKIKDNSLEEYFNILVDGKIISKEQWENTYPKDSQDILIAIVPKGGQFGQIFKQVVIIAAIVAASAAGQAWALGPLATAGLVAGTGLAATLLMNSLIPPPDAGLSDLNVSNYSYSDSQMYSITGQSNSTKKYGNVPKVYGRHRIFPLIAANPYTELETGENGELVQYFYGIYDIGYGPNVVSNVKLGDTLLSQYSNASYRLVDLNVPDPNPSITVGLTINSSAGTITRASGSWSANGVLDDSTILLSGFSTPANNTIVKVASVDSPTVISYDTSYSVLTSDTGDSFRLIYLWDEQLSKSFVYYRGEVTQSLINLVLSSNQNDPGATESSYRGIRTTDANPNNYGQEISLVLVFPQGLLTQNTDGSRSARKVDLQVEFAETGTNNWRPFGNVSYVSSFNAIGNTSQEGVVTSINLAPASHTSGFDFQYYNLLNVWPVYSYEMWAITNGAFYSFDPAYTNYINDYGFTKGRKDFYSTEEALSIGDHITHNGTRIGQIAQKIDVGGGVYRYVMTGGFPYSITIFRNYLIRRNSDGFTTVYNNPVTAPLTLFNESNYGANVTISASTTESVYTQIKFTPKTKSQLDIRVTRLRSYGGYSYYIQDAMTWYTLTTRFDRVPIDTNIRHTFLELKIKATDQLSGTVTNLNVEASSVLDVYNGTTWGKKETRNPAWVFADILTGEVNKKAVDRNRLDVNSLLEWSEYCDEVPPDAPLRQFELARHQCNFILDYNATTQSILGQVTSAANASLNLISGRYGVLIDKNKTVPVQVFTPRNSSNFNSARNYVETPHALKVKYVDASNEWTVQEQIVYDDGYDSSNATLFEELNTFACTNDEQAWRYGRYMLAQARLRQENITITVDFENLVCTRGDYVLLQHDVMKVGGRPARVKTVVGSVITIDDNFITEIGVDYGYTFRSVSGISTSTMTITDSETATLDGDIPSVGDLIVWGEVGLITIDCIVKSINPINDMAAQVQLVEKAEAIYSAESSGEFPEYDPQISTSVDANTQPPNEVESLSILETSFDCQNGGYLYYVDLDWNVPIGSVVEAYEIYTNYGFGYELVDVITPTGYRYQVEENNLGNEHSFKVLSVAANGSKLSLGEVGAVATTPVSKTTPPSNVDGLFINILDQTLQLDWDLVPDCDINYYLIRYSPTLTASWSNSIPLLTVNSKASLANVQARTGSYFIKAVDWNGNESTTAALATTAIPDLVNLNIVAETNDFPTLLGPYDRVNAFSGSLILDEEVPGDPPQYYSEGYYTYKNLLDLSEIYDVRLSSLIEAEGYSANDLMVNWITLADVTFMATSAVSDWNVETYYRSSESLNVIADWVTMDIIDPISEGAQDLWTEWRRFTIGDFTGRIFQFRLKLISNKPSITPRVFDGVIKADMPDRVYSEDNLVAPNTGLSVTYTPAFAGPGTTPNIQITQDNAAQGDYYVYGAKSLSGFSITFYDKNDVAVSRQFDYVAKGYGRKAAVIL